MFKTSNIDFSSFGLTDDEIDLLKSTVATKVPSSTYMTGKIESQTNIKNIIKKNIPYLFNKTVQEYASILATKWKHITFGCAALDKITRNGLPIRGITEIVGESGCGKTQLCLQLTLNVQLSLADGGLERSAVYICTEDAFPSKRLVQMANYHKRQFGNDNWLDNIFIEYCHDSVRLNCSTI